MKTLSFRYMIMAAISLLILTGCTTNNGDIGDILGQWQLTGISSGDGHATADTDTRMYWSFQSTTIKVLTVSERHQTSETYGNFRISDETLFLDFPDERFPMLIPETGRQSEWQIISLSSKSMTLGKPLAGGETQIWHFRKW